VSKGHILIYEAGNYINREDSYKSMKRNHFYLCTGMIQGQSRAGGQSDCMKFTLMPKAMQNLLIL